MPNLIKYNVSAETLALKKGNFWIGTGDVPKGPTSTTGYWNGITPPAGGYTIYLNKASNGPSMYAPSNDAQLIDITNKIAGTSYTTVNECFNYYAGQSDKMVFNIDYPPIITNGLSLNLDGRFTPSYPRNGTTWYDISSSGPNNVTLSNGPSFNTDGNGNIVFDGSDDYANFYAPNLGTTTTVEMLCKMGSAYDGKMFFGFLYYDVWCGSSCLGYNTAQGDVYGISSASVSSLGLVGNWKHYVFEMRSDVSYSNNKIYVNGVSQTLTQQFGGEGSGNRNFNSGYGRISSWLADLNYPMPMNCGFFRVYNRALTQSEILQNYYQGGIVTENITHRWDFSNLVSYPGTGTVVKNLKGSVNATLYNGPTFSSQYGGYLDFDGSDDYMSLDGGNYAITMGDGNSPWTINAWVRTTTGADALGQGPVISNSSGGPVYSMMGVNGGKIVYWVYPSNINSWKSFKGNITINDGNWHMLTWVQNVGYSMNMYVDGVLDTTVSPTNAGNNNPLDIIGGSWASNFNGDIAEVQINTTAFTQAQVLQQFNTVRSRFGI